MAGAAVGRPELKPGGSAFWQDAVQWLFHNDSMIPRRSRPVSGVGQNERLDMVQGYHAILGVRPDASRDEVLSAYAALVKRFHPDHNHARNATREFRRIQNAFEMLYEPERHQRKVGAFHTDASAFLRVRCLRHRGSAPDFSQGFGGIIVLLTVCYVLVAAVSFLPMVDGTWFATTTGSGPVPGMPGSEIIDYRVVGAVVFEVVFAVATLLYIVAVATVIVVSTKR